MRLNEHDVDIVKMLAEDLWKNNKVSIVRASIEALEIYLKRSAVVPGFSLESREYEDIGSLEDL